MGLKTIKKIIAIVLFVIGTFFLAVAFSLFKSSIGGAILALACAAIAFAYPGLKVLDYTSQKKSNGEKWMALPAFAISVPLFFGCLGLAAPDTSKERKADETVTEYSVTEVETTQAEAEKETTVTTAAPTPTPVPTEATTEETTTAAPTTEAMKETTKETTKATTKTTTAPTTVATETPSETVAPTTEAPKETEKPTEASVAAVVVPVPETTPAASETSPAMDYIANTNTKKFHYPDCNSVRAMKEKNKAERHCSREELINEGYSPCGNCNP